ncbi:M56 family metallopeptidase [Chitinophaga tropicalis]|uniref:M48 family metalloprotease n=1 Tax=Chitinophaga tropicalis TaxID=2683588 RepID=A0A7K1U7T1_9BACT|nr:M56 family metallopeptidase [Chitinophaga tropicalis]MVT10410.1 M48 family metalloprotease [Chitinophaga tropicalis]
MIAQLPFTADLVPAFGWALLHSFWQAFFIFACLRLVLLIWPQASSGIKYNLSYISLTGIFTWFTVTLVQQIQAIRKVKEAAQMMIETGVRQTVPVQVPVIYHSQEELTGLFPNLEMWFPVVVAIYVAGVTVMTIKLIMDLLQLQQIKQKQVLAIDPVWERHLEKLAAQLRIPRKIKLLISQHIEVPVMIGFLKPVILMPIAMFNNLTAEQLEAILLHELAHTKRNDYLLNIFQSIVETILFFNPFVWWISKNIRLEREHCCDDLVIASKVQPLHYAKALVALEEYRLTVNALAMAAADNKQHLFHRIKRIMEMKTKNINYTQKLLAVMIIAVGLVSIAWLNPSSANKEERKETPRKTTHAVIINPVAPAITTPVIIHALKTAQKYLDTVPASTEAARKAKLEAEKQAQASIEAAKAGMEAANEAMKNIDWNEINKEVNNAMKNIDWNQINKHVEEAMKNIDWNKINEEVKNSLKDTDTNIDPKVIEESVRAGMESARAAMSSEAVKKSIDEARNAMNSKEYKEAMANAKREMDRAQAEVRRAQAEVREQQINIQKNQVILQQNHQAAVRADHARKLNDEKYHTLIDKMAADKLINVDEGYTIENKDGVLKINGVEQPAEVQKKYAGFIKSTSTLYIQGKKDILNITVNEK